MTDPGGGGFLGFPAPPQQRPPATPPPPFPPPPSAGGGTPLWLTVLAVVAVVAIPAFWLLEEVLEAGVDRSTRSEVWSVDLAGRGRAEGLVTDGEVVCVTREAILSCVEVATGKVRFTQRLEGAATAPQLVGDMLIVGDGGKYPFEHTTLHGITVQGDELWSSERVPEDADQIALAHGFAIVGPIIAAPHGGATAQENTVEGLAPPTGSPQWHLGGNSQGIAFLTNQVFAAGERFYTMALDPSTGSGTVTLIAVEPATGHELWRHDLDGTPLITSVTAPVDGKTVAVVTKEDHDAKLLTLDAATGAERWAVPLRDEFPEVAVDDGITVVLEGTKLRALDREGQQRWTSTSPGGRTDPRLVQAAGHLYLVGVNVYEVDPRTGDIDTVRNDVVGHDLVVVGDRLVLSTFDGLEAYPLD